MKDKELKNLILAVLFFLLSVLVFYLLVKEINNHKIKFSNLSVLLKESQDNRKEIFDLNKNITAVSESFETLNKFFLNQEDIGIFLDSLEEDALSTGAKIEIVNVSSVIEPKKLTVNFKMTGSFQAINDFIIVLENHDYEIEILSIKTQKEVFSLEAGSNSPFWRADVLINVISLN